MHYHSLYLPYWRETAVSFSTCCQYRSLASICHPLITTAMYDNCCVGKYCIYTLTDSDLCRRIAITYRARTNHQREIGRPRAGILQEVSTTSAINESNL